MSEGYREEREQQHTKGKRESITTSTDELNGRQCGRRRERNDVGARKRGTVQVRVEDHQIENERKYWIKRNQDGNASKTHNTKPQGLQLAHKPYPFSVKGYGFGLTTTLNFHFFPCFFVCTRHAFFRNCKTCIVAFFFLQRYLP